jgi:hypothetical protein
MDDEVNSRPFRNLRPLLTFAPGRQKNCRNADFVLEWTWREGEGKFGVVREKAMASHLENAATEADDLLLTELAREEVARISLAGKQGKSPRPYDPVRLFGKTPRSGAQVARELAEIAKDHLPPRSQGGEHELRE